MKECGSRSTRSPRLGARSRGPRGAGRSQAPVPRGWRTVTPTWKSERAPLVYEPLQRFARVAGRWAWLWTHAQVTVTPPGPPLESAAAPAGGSRRSGDRAERGQGLGGEPQPCAREGNSYPPPQACVDGRVGKGPWGRRARRWKDASLPWDVTGCLQGLGVQSGDLGLTGHVRDGLTSHGGVPGGVTADRAASPTLVRQELWGDLRPCGVWKLFQFAQLGSTSWVEKIQPGAPGGPSVTRLPSAQVVISGSWDRVPHPAPCSAGRLPLPLPLPCSRAPHLSLCLSLKLIKSSTKAASGRMRSQGGLWAQTGRGGRCPCPGAGQALPPAEGTASGEDSEQQRPVLGFLSGTFALRPASHTSRARHMLVVGSRLRGDFCVSAPPGSAGTGCGTAPSVLLE